MWALWQRSRRAGARVIATVSSEEKAEHARTGGADHTIDYKRENVAETALALTRGAGVDHDEVVAETMVLGEGDRVHRSRSA